MKRAVFLDRDGVINQPIVRDGKPYAPRSVSETELVERAEESLERLKKAGFLLIVVTNQPDVARGTTARAKVEEIHEFLAAKLPIDCFFACYHDDKDHCACRKPMPGLIFDAAAKYGIEIDRSYMIGDRWRDVAAGMAAGCRTIFIDHRYNERGPDTEPDMRVGSLAEAVDRILREVKQN